MNIQLNLQINPLSDIALYEQIAEQIKQQILSGALAEHTLLPSVRGLAQMLGISVITTRRAYTELEQQGYVLTIPAKGTFVSYGYRERLKELGMLKL
ncbi:MAG: GntR family transcriptional regulator, partial [Peptococcaceae bacterium]|nr:GntR family transcriptional regulator [Peptococcaceae bacterium]